MAVRPERAADANHPGVRFEECALEDLYELEYTEQELARLRAAPAVFAARSWTVLDGTERVFAVYGSTVTRTADGVQVTRLCPECHKCHTREVQVDDMFREVRPTHSAFSIGQTGGPGPSPPGCPQ